MRRIIEKVLNFELGKQINFHPSQRGVIKGLTGYHLNTEIIDEVIRPAKKERDDSTVAFLDITGAFDNVGHCHIIKTLEARDVSADLRNIISTLLTNNTIRISAGIKTADEIKVQ